MKARTLILRGLLEALVLDSLYSEPKHGYGLIKELEAAVGALPGKNQIYPLLTRLEQEGLIASREEAGEGGRPRMVYALTHRGEKRLTEYKALPHEFRDRLFHLWGHGLPAPPPGTGAAPALDTTADSEDDDEDDEEDVPLSTPLAPAPAPRPLAEAGTGGWVRRILAQIPPGATVRCPHAEVELRREPATGGWTLRAARADIAAHPGHDDCALCFVIQAAVRTLFTPSGAGP